MKWLTLTQIKQQLRIEQDFTLEDSLLESYGQSAEDAILNLLARDYTQVVELYGEVPSPIVNASLMLVTHIYQNRGSFTMQQLHGNPTFDLMLKPYMKLASDSNGQTNTQGYGTGCKNL